MPLSFQVGIADDLVDEPQHGRLLVILAKDDEEEPRSLLEDADFGDKPAGVAVDLQQIQAGEIISIDNSAQPYGLTQLRDLKPGLYFVQALLNRSRDNRGLNGSGNLVSDVARLRLDPEKSGIIRLTLNRELTDDEPTSNSFLQYVTIKSELLSKFHGRPVMLKAGVILPREYDAEPDRRYPLWIHIGSGNSSFSQIRQLFGSNSHRTDFRQAWLAPDAPKMILLHLDNRGPFGCPYFVNSENNGPYGDAVTRELIPYVEKHWRALGNPNSRVLSGASTGGWSALALQIFYPDYFNGVWAGQPDPVDFRAYMTINIYSDKNAYADENGIERKSLRPRWPWQHETTVREECIFENFLSPQGSYRLSGADWGAWNAVFGPRGDDGLPKPLWDERTGAIDFSVAEKFKSYDLRLILENNWPVLGPKLHNKIHIWIGEADNFYLERAVHLLDDFLKSATNPPFDGDIRFGPRKGHSWTPMSTAELMREMQKAAGTP